MTGRLFPDTLVDEIKNRNDIVSVVEQYVRLEKKSTQNLFGLCPFHSEKTPSFSVSPGKQIFYCFGCNKGGDVVRFIQEIEKVEYPDALRLLAERAGIQVPEPEDEAYRQRSARNRTILAALVESARYFYTALNGPEGEAARRYLERRGFQPGTVRKFGLGFAPNDRRGLRGHLAAKGYDDRLLAETGLFRIREGTQEPSDLFRNRLMFPILDVMGRVVAFGGRVLDDSQPKYINSPESPVYVKGRHLYALQIAKKTKEPHLVVVEGYLDAIAMHQAGIDCAVASLGTALTESQALLLRRYSEDIVIGYDADAAGQRAALRGLDILSGKGCRVRVLVIPDGKDPDGYIRNHGPERFRALLQDAMPLLDFRLYTAERASTRNGIPDILAYQDAACDILAREENAVLRELYASKIADRCGVSPERVLQETERRIVLSREGASAAAPTVRERPPAPGPAGKEPEDADDAAGKEEFLLLCLLAHSPDLLERMSSPPVPEDFSRGVMRSLAEEALPRIADRRLDIADLVRLGEGRKIRGRPVADLVARGSMQFHEDAPAGELLETAERLLRKTRTLSLRSNRDALLSRLAGTPDSGEDARRLRDELRTVNQKIAALRES